MSKTPRTTLRRNLLATLISATIATTLQLPAHAGEQRQVELQASSLSQALNEVAARWGLQLSYDSALVEGLQSHAIAGSLTVEDVLSQLLAGSGLDWRYLDPQTLTLEATGRAVNLESTVISATRSVEDVLNLPNAVTVMERAEIEALSRTTRNMGELLSRVVPGLATSAESQSSYSQTLRGRQLTVLIDGVPQSGALRNSSRDLVIIDSDMVERVEVLRGPTGVYGYGATGGLINIITRTPDEEALSFSSKVGTRFSPESSDSLAYDLFQQVSGAQGDSRFIGSASYETAGLFYDGTGEAIPTDPHGQGGVADASNFDLYAKVEHDLSADETLTASFNHAKISQDNDYHTVSGHYGQQAASLAEGGVANAQGYETSNWTANLQYSNSAILGGELNAQLFAQAGEAVNKYNSKLSGQSVTESEKQGLRLTHNLPLSALPEGAVVWGFDFTREDANQHFTDGRNWTPEMRQDSYAPFANLRFNLSDQLIARAGVRYDYFRLDVEDFTATNGNAIQGGKLNYDEVTWNAGLTWLLSDETSLYGSWSQGYSVPDIGRILRDGTADLAALSPEAQLVDNYELGFKGDWDNVQSTVAVFYNESDLGLRFTGDANGTNYAPKRSPEKVYGLEATVDWQPAEQLRTGGSLTWSEGKLDSNSDGSYDSYLGGERIAPLKLTAYLSHQTSERWSNRIDALYSGDRDRFSAENTAADVDSSDSLKRQFGHGKADNFVLFDLTSSYQLANDAGSLHFTVTNLLDEDYYTVESMARNRDAQYSKGRGRTFGLTYNVNW